MENSEGSSMPASKIKPPSRIGSPGKGGSLIELSEAENNARVKSSRLPVTGKHKMAAESLPEAKRQTLADRAGDFKNVEATPAPRPKMKGQSLQATGMRQPNSIYRNHSVSSSTSGRSTSHTRTASNSSFASSVGPGSRHPSSSSSFSRSQTSQGSFSKSVNGKPTYASNKQRPHTAMAYTHEEEDEDEEEPPLTGKRKGMNPISKLPSSIQSVSMRLPKVRGKSSTQSPERKVSNREVQRKVSNREISVTTAVTTAFSGLNINDKDRKDSISDSLKNVVAEKLQMSSSHQPSLNSAMRNLNIEDKGRNDVAPHARYSIPPTPQTPSLIPKLKAEANKIATPAPSPTKSISPSKTPFLTKSSDVPQFTAWDTEKRLGAMEGAFEILKTQLNSTVNVKDTLEQAADLYKARIAELESIRIQLTSTNVTMQTELESTRQQLSATNATMHDERRANRLETEDLTRQHRNEMEDLRRRLTDDTDRLLQKHRNELQDLEKRKNSEHEDEKNALMREFQQVKAQLAEGNESTEAEKQKKEREIDRLREELENIQGELDREQVRNKNLQNNVSEVTSTCTTLENTVRSLRSQITFLESDSMSQSQRFEDMENRLQAALSSAKESKEKLMKEESIRRSLFNQVQELKGNIRVMCRVRPVFGEEGPDDSASISFPDSHKESKELEILGQVEKTSLGKETRKVNAFSFDRVFGQSSQNEEIFEEISQLVQSALDGYNVCIFCYGQTGAGKTYTMSSADGMIPRAVKQIYETATKLQEKNWKYKMEGSFIEVYNEDLHDLLGNPKDFNKKKHEIRHDNQKKQTTVTDLTSVELDSADTVEMILSKAMANRSVAATLSNERSSRSHSVFILKLLGTNTTTGEVSEGTLNLVDLAGSERLKQSGAEGARMKETQNINKSLSCLGDVIGALGNGKEGSHIPYRNSKLTYLLQFSLGGNSKTLMFVMISPLQAHLNETLTSLKFATKVHNTHIGTAKKTTKMRE